MLYTHLLFHTFFLHPFALMDYANIQHGAYGGVVVKALRYKLAGRRSDSRWCHWNFSVT